MNDELMLGTEIEIEGCVFACDGAAHSVSDAWLMIPGTLSGDMDRLLTARIRFVVVERGEVEVVTEGGDGVWCAEAMDDEIGVVDVEIVEDSSGACVVSVEIDGPVGA